MFLNNRRKIEKEALLEELAKEDLQVLSLAYIYAKNLHMYGEDVTKASCSAIQNVAMLDKAYKKGYYDAMQRPSAEWVDDKCSACGKGIDDLIESSEWYQNESPRYCPFCGIKIQQYKAESEDRK